MCYAACRVGDEAVASTRTPIDVRVSIAVAAGWRSLTSPGFWRCRTHVPKEPRAARRTVGLVKPTSAKRSSRSRRPSLRVVRLLGLAVVCAVALAYVQPVRSYLEAREDVARHRETRAALLRQQNALHHRLELAGTDEFVIREARRMGLVIPGERLFIIKGVEKWRAAHRVR